MKSILYPILFLPTLIFSQSIKGNFSPPTDFTYAFVYKSSPKGVSYMNEGKLNTQGSFEIQLDSTYTPGIYKLVYGTPAQDNNFDIIYDGKETIAFNFNKKQGVVFTESEENKLWHSYLNSIDMVNLTISNYYAKNEKDTEGFNAIFKTLNDTQQGYEDLAKDKLVLDFITSSRPYIPEDYEDIKTYLNALKNHYFKNINFDSALLQSSTFLSMKVFNYIFNMYENPDNLTYKLLVDDLAKALRNTNTEVKMQLLVDLWYYFVDFENQELVNYISDAYLLALSETTGNIVLKHSIIAYKNTSIGVKAPNFDIDSTKSKTSLYDLDISDYYLLVFWSSTCGHCLDAMPKIQKLVKDKSNLKVVAFGLESEKKNWSEEIKNYPEFIHQMGEKKWENAIVNTYGLNATPTYFLLDNSKKIIAKPTNFEEVKKEIEKLK